MAQLKIGCTAEGDATLRAERFNRHTFWCGQSGSGKTYALGVVLEQLLLRTRLPMLILDPNADFVGLGSPRENADEAAAARIRAADIRVLQSSAGDGEPLRVRFIDLDLRSKGAVLRLDPVAHPDEYNVLLHLEDEFGPMGEHGLLEALRASDVLGRRKLAVRIENLRVLEWDLWARGGTAAEDVVDARPDAVILELSGFAYRDEPSVAALSVLDHLWAHRHERNPMLIVIDEAHNLCAPNPVTPLETALTERIAQIAAEGRKYGLWLLLSTQRPSKIHPNVISQCDNLALMKVSSPRDLAELTDVFGYVSPDLIARSPNFGLGEGLFAGGFIGSPAIVRIGARLTREGGTDVKVPLR